MTFTHAGITSFEWACPHCPESGTGFMPEEHASGSCAPTQTTPRMVPEIATRTRHMVRLMLDGTLYMDGGGI
jgi:hypothetical protein